MRDRRFTPYHNHAVPGLVLAVVLVLAVLAGVVWLVDGRLDLDRTFNPPSAPVTSTVGP